MTRAPLPPVLRLAASLMLAAATLAPAGAAAQTTKEIAAAKKAFHEGEEAEAKGDYVTALDRFQAALAVKTTAQLHLRVGVVEEKLGRLRDALASYERGLALTSALPAVAKIAREQIDALTPRIPTVTVTVTAPPPGLTVTLDEAPFTAFGAAVPLDPGMHHLHAEAPGRPSRDETFLAAERGRTPLTLDLALPAPAEPDGLSKLPAALALGGGGAALVVGAVLIGVSVAKDGHINALCGGADRLLCPQSRQQEILGDVRAVNALRFSGIGVGIAGAAGVVVGAVLLTKAAPASAPATGGLTLVPVIGPRMVGLSGRF